MLVIGCIEAKFCKKICVGKLSPRSTQCTPLHRFGIESQKPGKPWGEKNRSLSLNFCSKIVKFIFQFLRSARAGAHACFANSANAVMLLFLAAWQARAVRLSDQDRLSGSAPLYEVPASAPILMHRETPLSISNLLSIYCKKDARNASCCVCCW